MVYKKLWSWLMFALIILFVLLIFLVTGLNRYDNASTSEIDAEKKKAKSVEISEEEFVGEKGLEKESENEVPDYLSELSDPYRILLEDLRIRNAIKENLYIESDNYLELLAQKINELEGGNTQDWDFYRHSPYWTNEEKREVYLQKVALSLYVEANEVVPWSLLDYSDDELNLILSDLSREKEDYEKGDGVLFGGNPLKPFRYVEEIKEIYSKSSFRNQKDLIDFIITRFRDDNWVHFSTSRPVVCDFSFGDNFPLLDFECLTKIKEGGDLTMSLYIYALLQSHNVPSKIIEKYLGGHPGIHFVSENLTMKGNNPFADFMSGNPITKPVSKIPVDHSYIDYETYKDLDALPACLAWSKRDRTILLNYLGTYDDPEYNEDIIYAYNYRETGDYLRAILKGEVPGDCQDDDPSEQEKYYPPPLDGKEIDEWIEKIGERVKSQ